jgi:hypothetical protein
MRKKKGHQSAYIGIGVIWVEVLKERNGIQLNIPYDVYKFTKKDRTKKGRQLLKNISTVLRYYGRFVRPGDNKGLAYSHVYTEPGKLRG